MSSDASESYFSSVSYCILIENVKFNQYWCFPCPTAGNVHPTGKNMPERFKVRLPEFFNLVQIKHINPKI